MASAKHGSFHGYDKNGKASFAASGNIFLAFKYYYSVEH
jgi:hypothetical protein